MKWLGGIGMRYRGTEQRTLGITHGNFAGSRMKNTGVLLATMMSRGQPSVHAQEKDKGTQVPVALLSPELDCKATRITSSIRRSRLPSNSRESDGQGSLLAHSAEEVCSGDVAEVMGGGEDTMGASSLGVDNTLGDTLAVKVGEKVDVVEV